MFPGPDPYARSAAGPGRSVLEALSGFRYDALSATLTFTPLAIARTGDTWQLPFVAGTGWGAAISTPTPSPSNAAPAT